MKRAVFLAMACLMLMGIGQLQPTSSGSVIDYAVARFPGTIEVRKFGHNPDIDTAADEDIWEAGDTLTYLTTASAIEAISDSLNDIDTTGSGCRKIVISGLDGNWDIASEELAMNGTSATTASSTTFIRVNRAYCSEVGSYGAVNAGNITIRVSGAGSTQAYISAAEGQTEMSHYTVPRGYTAYLLDVHISVASGKTSTVTFHQRQGADNTSSSYTSDRIVSNFVGLSGAEDYRYNAVTSFPEKTDLWAEGDPAANDTDITFEYSMLLIRNNR